jgi:signal transduction histidine kinase
MIKQNTQLTYKSNLEGKRYDFTVETVMYRVACELITNTLRHAAARNLSISLSQDAGILSMHYSDDGIGFDMEEMANNKGMGLSNIESRVKSINGAIAIVSSPKNGMKVSINVRV